MGFEGREAMGYDHCYDGEIFYLGLALDPFYVEGLVEGCLERIGEDLLRGEWEEADRETALQILRAECEVRPGRPARAARLAGGSLDAVYAVENLACIPYSPNLVVGQFRELRL